MRPFSIVLASLVAFSTLLASALAEPNPKSEAVQAAESREVDAIGPPWHSEELCCRPGCTWCGYEPCSINNCNMPVSFPFDICCALSVSKKRDVNGVPLHAYNQAGELVTFVSSTEVLASTPSADYNIEPTPTTTIVTKSDLAGSAPAAANQLEERIRIENWCCLPNCARCRNQQCLQVQCSWPYYTCCEIDVFKKRDLDGLPMQAFNKAGEPVTFISDAEALVELPSTFTTSTTPPAEPTSAITALAKPRDIDAVGPPWTYQDQLCCRPGCKSCGWSPCQYGCAWEPFLNTCCSVSVAEGKRDGAVQAWNQHGEPVTFVSDLVTTRRQELEVAAIQERERQGAM